MDTPQQACDHCTRPLHPITARIAPEHITSGGPLGGHDRPQQQEPLNRVTHDFFQDDLQRFHRLFHQGSLLECTDEGPIAYIVTWYIHHQRQRICREGRPHRITSDTTTWKEEILALWEDVLDPDYHTTIHLVRPPPPCARTECVLAHLILEQSERPHHVDGLITIHAHDQYGDSTQHTAYSLPNAMTAQSVLRTAEMHVFCQTRICSVRLGAWPFGMVDIDDVPRAAGLSINIRPLIPINEEFDSSDLMQRSRTRWRRELTPQDDQDSSSAPHRCSQTHFHFNPAAPAFDPTAPTIFTMNENIQELHQYWLRTAFSWEGEMPSTTIQSWFVDHHDPNLWTCTQSRAVRLFEDFTQWETQIRHAWRDLVNPTMPWELQVVIPTPINTATETAAHVLVVQGPLDAFATILTTVHDANQATGSAVMQLAITTHEHLYLQNLLFALGLTGRCVVTGAPMTCQAWYGNYMLQLGIPFPARNGQGILIQMHRRPTFQDHRDSLSLLQTRTELTSRVRPTHGTVAQAHGPRQDSEQLLNFPEEPEPSEALTCIVYILWPPHYQAAHPLVPFVEVEKPGTKSQVQQALSCWGLLGDVHECGQHDTMYFCPQDDEQKEIHIYCNEDITVQNGIQVQVGPPALDDLVHMKLLYKQGYHKAVIIRRELVNDFLTICIFATSSHNMNKMIGHYGSLLHGPLSSHCRQISRSPLSPTALTVLNPHTFSHLTARSYNSFSTRSQLTLYKTSRMRSQTSSRQPFISAGLSPDMTVLSSIPTDLRRAGRGTVHPYGLTFMT